MSTVSVEALREKIEVERAAHAAAMSAIAEQIRNFQAILREDQQAFTDLVTRVTTLRVAKGEYLAAQAEDRAQHVAFNTGSNQLDQLLYAIQAKLDGRATASMSTAASPSVLRNLETAALEAMTPFGARRVSALFTSNAAAVRTTGVLLLFPNDVRGVRAWARRHVGSCASCAARLAQPPPWAPHRYDGKAAGFAAAPNLRAIPNKRYHNLTCSLLQERSLADRMDTEQRLDLLRGTFFVHVQSANAEQPLADAAAACTAMADALQTLLTASMSELREAARTSAPWSVGATSNSDVSAAMEILLHMVEPRVSVQEVPQPAVTRSGAPCTLLQVNTAVSVPLQVSAVAPLLQLLYVPEHRRYLIDHVLTPLAKRVGDALGVGAQAAHYTGVGLRFAEALYRMAVQEGLVSGEDGRCDAAGTETFSLTSASHAALAQLYYVLQALAVFGTTVEVELATPPLHLDCASTTQKIKMAVVKLLESVLQHLTPPTPLVVPPPANDPQFTELTVKIARAPTSFLEIMNRTFSSNHRMPATSRSSKLDTFMSPKSKISLGLKLFRELVVDVYRPYHPRTGVVVAAENGVGGRPRAPACVPVVDLPVDCVTANVRVANAAVAVADALRQYAAAMDTTGAPQSETVTAVERAGAAALARVTERLRCASAVKDFCARWTAAQVQVVGVAKACVDVALPFSMTEVDLRSATKPLLYLRVVYEC